MKKIAKATREGKDLKKVIFAIIYARKGNDGEGSAESIGLQVKECKKFAKERGYIVGADSIYTDTYSGGGKYTERPGLKDILEQIDQSPERTFVIIVRDISRITRSYEMYESYSAALGSRGVAILSTTARYSESPEEQLKMDISWVMSRYEYNMRHQRAMEAIRQKMKK